MLPRFFFVSPALTMPSDASMLKRTIISTRKETVVETNVSPFGLHQRLATKSYRDKLLVGWGKLGERGSEKGWHFLTAPLTKFPPTYK